MPRPVSDIAFTPAVKGIQEREGSRAAYAKMEDGRGWSDRITPDLKAFLKERDSFYIATTNSEGQPYIQHRGGKKGFLKVIDEETLAFADFKGNRQYVSMGNLSENDQAFIFLMDYPNRTRIKIWGRAEVVENNEELQSKLTDSDYGGVVERAFVFHVEAWDANCPQHIHPRYTKDEIEDLLGGMREKIQNLETENENLKKQLAGE